MKRIAKFGLMAALLGMGLAVLAQGPLRNPKMVEKLGLTPQQQSQMKELKFQHQTRMIDIRHDMQLKMLDLKRELSKDNPSQTALDSLVDQITAIRAKMMKERFAHMLAVKKILTPEQWRMVKDHFMERRAMRRGKGHRGMRGGSGCKGMGPGRGQGRGFGRGQGPGPGPAPDAPGNPQP